MDILIFCIQISVQKYILLPKYSTCLGGYDRKGVRASTKTVTLKAVGSPQPLAADCPTATSVQKENNASSFTLTRKQGN